MKGGGRIGWLPKSLDLQNARVAPGEGVRTPWGREGLDKNGVPSERGVASFRERRRGAGWGGILKQEQVFSQSRKIGRACVCEASGQGEDDSCSLCKGVNPLTSLRVETRMFAPCVRRRKDR